MKVIIATLIFSLITYVASGGKWTHVAIWWGTTAVVILFIYIYDYLDRRGH